METIDNQGLIFPSEVVSINIEGNGSKYKIRIPKREIPTAGEIFEKNEYAIKGPRLQTGPMTVVDIGANVGLFALYMKFQDPGSTIHCFEPSPPTLTLLQSNLGQIPGIYVHPYGLFDKEADADFFLHRYNTGENSVKHTAPYFSRSMKVKLKDAASEFDRLGLDRIDVLKLDTEGCEVEILKSIGHRLLNVNYIMVEYHNEPDRREIDNLLKDFHLLAAQSDRLGFGVLKYINPKLVESYCLAERGSDEDAGNPSENI